MYLMNFITVIVTLLKTTFQAEFSKKHAVFLIQGRYGDSPAEICRKNGCISVAANSRNIFILCCILKENNVPSAYVSGWNGTAGDYVLHANGALAPWCVITNDTNYAFCIKEYPCLEYKIGDVNSWHNAIVKHGSAEYCSPQQVARCSSSSVECVIPKPIPCPTESPFCPTPYCVDEKTICNPPSNHELSKKGTVSKCQLPCSVVCSSFDSNSSCEKNKAGLSSSSGNNEKVCPSVQCPSFCAVKVKYEDCPGKLRSGDVVRYEYLLKKCCSEFIIDPCSISRLRKRYRMREIKTTENQRVRDFVVKLQSPNFNSTDEIPAILRCPYGLFKLQQDLSCEYQTEVCLYIGGINSGHVYATIKNFFYHVRIPLKKLCKGRFKPSCIRLKQVRAREFEKLTSKGLSKLTFGEIREDDC